MIVKDQLKYLIIKLDKIKLIIICAERILKSLLYLLEN